MWPRSAIRAAISTTAPTFSGFTTRWTASWTQAARASTSSSRRRWVMRRAFGVLLERHRPGVEQPDRTGRHLNHPAGQGKRVGCSVGAGVGQECGELAATGDTIHVTASISPAHTRHRSSRGGCTDAASYRTAMVLSLGQGAGSVRAQSALDSRLTLATGLGSWLWWRATVETPPGFPLQYAPPKRTRPVQCDYIRTEKVPAHALTATLFYLADRGLISLNQSGPRSGPSPGRSMRTTGPTSIPSAGRSAPFSRSPGRGQVRRERHRLIGRKARQGEDRYGGGSKPVGFR